MTVRNYINVTGTNALIAFVLYLYLEMAKVESLVKYLFLVLFIVFSVLTLVDTMKGGLKDKRIIGKITLGKLVIRK